MSHLIRRLALVPALLLLVLASAGSASAASRSFDVENHTKWDFDLHDVNRVSCSYWDRWPNACDLFDRYPREFEGRPDLDETLQPGKSHDFELSYEFSRLLTGTPNYAAEIRYGGAQSIVSIHINTTNYGRNSECEVTTESGRDRVMCKTNGGGTIKLLPADD